MLGYENFFVMILCIIGGIIFGYDVGSTGRRLTSIPSVLKHLYPATQMEKMASRDGRYCNNEEQTLGHFISSLYLASLLGSLLASTFTPQFSRKISMVLGGLLVFCGSLLSAFANAYWMSIVGRVLISIGIEFTNQCLQLYISEITSSRCTGSHFFQLSVTIGILVAKVVNYVLITEIKDVWGWRLSLAGTMIPAFIIIIGSFFLPKPHESNPSTTGSGITTEDRAPPKVVLQSPLKDLFMERKYRPYLCMAVLIPCFQQLTGINVIIIYGPVLLQTVGFGSGAAHLLAVLTSSVNVLSTWVSIYGVDKWGRRPLFIQGGVQMFISLVVVAVIFALPYGVDGEPLNLSNTNAIIVVLFICLYVAAFAWSWGPLGWLVPTEIFPPEIRSTAQNLSVKVNLIVTFLIPQVFLATHCHLRSWIFMFFAFWLMIMTCFICLLFPETKDISMYDDMEHIWKKHTFWGRFFDVDAINIVGKDETNLAINCEQQVK